MKRFAATLLALFLLALSGAPAAAAGIPPVPTGPSDPAEIQQFVDPLITAQLQQYHIPGAVLTIVKDGRIVYSKGYGLADVSRRTPIDPETTLFPIASVSKLFAGTAVMQLAEAGKLDLQANVNQYLKSFQVPDTFPQPITAANLLTHTAGFNEQVLGLAARSEAERLPLGQYLAAHLPTRVRPPGQEFQYSNDGIALAGYLVESITGVPYEQYITDQILKPLGMTHSTAILQEDRFPNRITPYAYRGGAYLPQPIWHVQPLPAGDIWSTGADMGHFMIAHLQGGQYDGRRILQAATEQEMQRQQFAYDPKMPGMAYTFFRIGRGEQVVLSHGGDVAGEISLLNLVPDSGWGFFVSYNADGGIAARSELQRQLLDHYAPIKPLTVSFTASGTEAQVARFAGTYVSNQYDRNTFGKLQIFGQGGRVTAYADGTITLPHDSTHYRQVGPLFFQAVNGSHYVMFREDSHGRITGVLGNPYAMERVPWYGAFPLQAGLLGFGLLTALLACLGWPVAALVRRLRRRAAPARAVTRAQWLAAGVGFLSLAFTAGMVPAFMDQNQLIFGLSPYYRIVVTLPLLAAVLTVVLVWQAAKVWRSDCWSLRGRLFYAVITLGAVALVPFYWYWNLLKF